MEAVKRLLAKKHIDADTGFRYRYIQSETEYFRLHCHEYFEIFLTLQGDIEHIINGRCEQLREGSLVLIRPDDIHDYKYQSGDLYRFINLAFDRETAQSLFIFLGRQACENALLLCAMPPVVRLSAGEKEKLLLLFQRINAVQRNDVLQAKTQMRLLLAQVVAKYFLAVPAALETNAPPWLEALCRAVAEELHFVEGAQKMVYLSGRSKEHLARMMKKYYGITTSEFINRLRLNYAANMLLNSNMAIIDICFESGFGNVSWFYSQFEGRYGVTPKQYRAAGGIL